MLSKIVKVGAVTNLTDARFFAAFDVNFIGFCFDPLSPDYISPQNALAIKGWITGPKIVAEFANQDMENVKNIIQFFEPDIIEVDENFYREITISQQPLPHQLIVKTNEDLTPDDQVLFFLTAFENRDKIVNKQHYIFDLSDSSEILPDLTGIAGIQLKGSPEQEVGIKSFEGIAAILEKLELIEE